MNINNIEEELKLVLRDKRFKLSNAGHRDNLINRIEDILIRIVKFNDALGNISYHIFKLIIMNCSERVEIIIPILFLNVLILWI